MSRLVPCTECARHVRVDEGACPFCDASMVGVHDPVIERAPGRVGRAAILAFRTLAVGAAGAAVGCGSTTGLELDDAMVVRADAGPAPDAGTTPSDAGPPEMDAGTDGGGGIMPLYGGPTPVPEEDAGADAGAGIAPAYGGPVPVPDAGPAEDAGWDGGGVANLYGAPPG